MTQRSLVPTAIHFEIDVRADNQQAVRDALLATLMAIRQNVEPNTLWGSGFCVAVKVGK